MVAMDRIATLQSRVQTRRRETRLKIIIGAVVLKRIRDMDNSAPDTTGTAFRGQVFRLVAGVLTLRDRDLLATVFPELANRSPSAPSSSAVPAPTSAPVQGGS